MHRQPVDSSAVLSVGYEKGVLEVEVEGGAIYQYLDVPARDFFGLLAADSKGRFYNQQIKPNYEYRKIR